jgi:hypothetical protein
MQLSGRESLVNTIFLTAIRFLKYTVWRNYRVQKYLRRKNMTSALLLLWALTGGALSTWLMMHIWLPDPPPDIVGRFFGVLIAGIVGGVAAGYVVHIAGGLEHMPGIVAAAAGGLILSGVVAAFIGAGRGGGRAS